MTQIPTLDQLDLSKSEVFYSDFTTLLLAAKGIDRYFALGKPELDLYIPRLKRAISLFNKKYKDITLVFKKSPEGIKIQITFRNEKDLLAFFGNAASRFKTIASLGLRGFGEIQISEPQKVEELLQKIKKRLYITYSDPEMGQSSILAHIDGKSIEFICEHQSLSIQASPEFKICAYYALRKPFEKKIDVLSSAASMGFTESITLEKPELIHDHEPFSRE